MAITIYNILLNVCQSYNDKVFDLFNLCYKDFFREPESFLLAMTAG